MRPTIAILLLTVLPAVPALAQHELTHTPEADGAVPAPAADAVPASFARPSTPPAVRPLGRDGGHSRPGFDDVVVPSPVDLPFWDIVDPARYIPGSLSLGTTSEGHLVGAARLPDDGVGHFVLAEHRERDTHYGTEELVGVILDAADHLAATWSGARVGIGNMSQRDGGDIRWSVSHNNGRDADLAFLFLDADGQPVEPETLLRVRRNGEVRGRDWTFDVARSWTLVEGLLTSERAQVQWIFIYEPLADMLLQHAAAIGADPVVIERAEQVLHQPGDSAPHDDHFHLRIFCPLDDRLEGCVNWGPSWDFADTWDDEVAHRVSELVRGLMAPDPTVASGCADFLDRLHPRAEAPVISAALPHLEPSVQLRLFELLRELDQPGTTGALVPIAESADDDGVRDAAFYLLGYLADQDAGLALAGVARRDGRPLGDGTSARLAAATALRNIYDARAVPDLIVSLDDADPDVRAAVEHVLRRTTGRTSPIDVTEPMDAAQRRELVLGWSRWYAEHGAEPREVWIEQMFLDAGYQPGDLSRAPDLQELLSALEDDADHVAFNADRMLLRHTDGWTPSEGWSTRRRVEYWSRRVR